MEKLYMILSFNLHLRVERTEEMDRYVVVCQSCKQVFGPKGEYPDDHAQVWDDIISPRLLAELLVIYGITSNILARKSETKEKMKMSLSL